MATIRHLTTQDRASLEAFTCSVLGEPWTQVAEDMVHALSGSLEGQRFQVIGAFEVDRLIAVGAWREENDPAWNQIDGSVWRSEVVAVQNGFKKQGHAAEMKRRMLTEARAAGVIAITSVVHYKNVAMRSLNERLGGTTRAAVKNAFEYDQDYGWCIILVRSARP
jgi:hypothetical protein